jgi:5-methylcytosine-specific restriction enzyme A
VPAEQILEADLRKLVELYKSLVDNEVAFSDVPDPIIPPIVEDLTRYRWHRRLDRDQRAIQEVKRAKGAVCEACKFDFEHFYGELGRGFIELHHLVAVSQLQGLQVSRDPIKDYAVLCSIATA